MIKNSPENESKYSSWRLPSREALIKGTLQAAGILTVAFISTDVLPALAQDNGENGTSVATEAPHEYPDNMPAFNYAVEVNASTLNLRAEPRLNAARVDGIPGGVRQGDILYIHDSQNVQRTTEADLAEEGADDFLEIVAIERDGDITVLETSVYVYNFDENPQNLNNSADLLNIAEDIAPSVATPAPTEPAQETPEVAAAPEAPTENPNDVETVVAPTEAPLVLNEDLPLTGTPETPATEITARTFDNEVGGYVVERDGFTMVYREGIQRVEVVDNIPKINGSVDPDFEYTGEGVVGDAVIADRFQTSNGLGTVTLEAPWEWDGLTYPEQNNQLQFNQSELAAQNLENGLQNFWIVTYQSAFGCTAEEAAQMLAEDRPIEVHWTTNANFALIRDTITEDIEQVFQVRPSQGVSFVIMPTPITFYRSAHDVMPYPTILPPTFYPSESDNMIGADTYGFGGSQNGRLIVYLEYLPDTNVPLYDINASLSVINRLAFLQEFVGEDGAQGNLVPTWQADRRGIPDDAVSIAEGFGLGSLDYSRYPADMNDSMYTQGPFVDVTPDGPFDPSIRE